VTLLASAGDLTDADLFIGLFSVGALLGVFHRAVLR
jgi:hypothetical protein